MKICISENISETLGKHYENISENIREILVKY